MKKLTKIIAIILALTLALCALTSCGAKGKTLEEVKAAGKLVVATSPESVNPTIRAIIDSDVKVNESSDTVRFSLKPHKVFLFDKETEKRIYFGNQTAPEEVEEN